MRNGKIVTALCIAMGISSMALGGVEAAQVIGDKTYTTNTTESDNTGHVVLGQVGENAGYGTTATLTFNPGVTVNINGTGTSTVQTSYAYGKDINYTSNWDADLNVSATTSGNNHSAIGLYAQQRYTAGTGSTASSKFQLNNLTVNATANTAGGFAQALGVSTQQGGSMIFNNNKTDVTANAYNSATGVLNGGGVTPAGSSQIEFGQGDVTLTAKTNAGADTIDGIALGLNTSADSTTNFNNKGNKVNITAANTGTNEFGHAWGIQNDGVITTNTYLDEFNVTANGAAYMYWDNSISDWAYSIGSIALYNGSTATANFDMHANTITMDATAATTTNFRGGATSVLNQDGNVTLDAKNLTINAKADYFNSIAYSAQSGNNNLTGENTLKITAENLTGHATGVTTGVNALLNINGGNIDVKATTRDGEAKGLDLYSSGVHTITSTNNTTIEATSTNNYATGINATGAGDLTITSTNATEITATNNETSGWHSAFGINSAGAGDITITSNSNKITSTSLGGDVYGILSSGTSGANTITLDGTTEIKAENAGASYTATGVKAANNREVKTSNGDLTIEAKANNALGGVQTITGVALDSGKFTSTNDTVSIKAEGVNAATYGADIWNNGTFTINQGVTTIEATNTTTGTARGIKMNTGTASITGDTLNLTATNVTGDAVYGADVMDAALNITENNVNVKAENTNDQDALGLKIYGTGAINMTDAQAVKIEAVANQGRARGIDAEATSGASNVTADDLTITATSTNGMANGVYNLGTNLTLVGTTNGTITGQSTTNTAYGILTSSNTGVTNFTSAVGTVKAQSQDATATGIWSAGGTTTVNNDTGTVTAESTNGTANALASASGTLNYTTQTGLITADTTGTGTNSASGVRATGGTINVAGINKVVATSAVVDNNFALAAASGTVNFNDANTAGANILEGNLNVTGTGTVNAKLNGANAYLTGWAQDNHHTGAVNLSLQDRATWNYVAKTDGTNSSVGTLTNSAGLVDMHYDTADQTLEVATLKGTGDYNMDTDLGSETDGDKMIVNASDNGAGGSIQIYDRSLLSGTKVTGDKKLLLVTDVNGTTNFVGKSLDAGGLWDMTPTLQRIGNDWYLVKMEDTLNQNGATIVANQRATYGMWRSALTDDTLRKRLGDLRYSDAEDGVWARVKSGKLNGTDFDNDYHTYQIGFDKKAGNTSFGLAVDHTTGKDSYLAGHGDSSMTGVSLYATNYRNDQTYSDVVVRYGRVGSDYDTTTAYQDEGDYSTKGYSISYEIGKTLRNNNGWFIEPQGQFTYGRLNGYDYTTKNGIKVDTDATTVALLRVGFVAGRKVAKDSDYYVKANVYHDLKGDNGSYLKAQSGQYYDYNEDLGGTWYELGLGGNVKLSPKTHLYGDVLKTFGGEINKKWQVNAGVRWEF